MHRDIKPQNILLNYDKNYRNDNCYAILTAKITDFGISRVLATVDEFGDSTEMNTSFENTEVLNNVAGKYYFD